MKVPSPHHPSPLRYYAKLALFAGIPFGLAMAALNGLMIGLTKGWQQGITVGVGSGLLAGVLFGIAMAAVLGTLARIATRRMGPGALDVCQRRVVELHQGHQDVIRRVSRALAGLPRAGPVRLDESRGVAEVIVGLSWRSFGEVVTARVETLGHDQHLVNVESRPTRNATMVDYGANAINADAVAAALVMPR